MNSERQQIYVAGALTGATNKVIEVYEIIEKVCDEAGFNAYLPHRDTGSRKSLIDPTEVFLKNTEALQNSVAVIAEVSNPSIGVGMECENALRYGMPLIAVARSDAQVSRMLRGHPLGTKLTRYRDTQELQSLLLERLRDELKTTQSSSGIFIAFEGMDGTGKSTLAKHCEAFYKEKFPGRPVLLISDPPDQEPWTEVKKVFEKQSSLNAQSEAILLLAARVDQVNREILPILNENGIVFADRFHDSWLIYQGERLQQCVPDATKPQVDYSLRLATVVAKSLGGLRLPDHTFVFTGDPQVLCERICRERGETNDKFETRDFLTSVRNRYVSTYERGSARMTLIDTTRRSLEDCKEMVLTYINEQLLEI